ncbi:Uridine kinase [Chlorociboria aeruginascens]|nr:Uridine kinase [Chlorociboria aeruginascens]
MSIPTDLASVRVRQCVGYWDGYGTLQVRVYPAGPRKAGQYLAIEYLASVIGIDEYSVPHVQGYHTLGYRLREERQTTIVALMRGGEPMAFGVSDICPLAKFCKLAVPKISSSVSIASDSMEGMICSILLELSGSRRFKLIRVQLSYAVAYRHVHYGYYRANQETNTFKQEYDCLDDLHDPAKGSAPTFPIPRVLYHKEYDNRHYLVTSRVPGDTPEKASPSMDEATKQATRMSSPAAEKPCRGRMVRPVALARGNAMRRWSLAVGPCIGSIWPVGTKQDLSSWTWESIGLCHKNASRLKGTTTRRGFQEGTTTDKTGTKHQYSGSSLPSISFKKPDLRLLAAHRGTDSNDSRSSKSSTRVMGQKGTVLESWASCDRDILNDGRVGLSNSAVISKSSERRVTRRASRIAT